MKKYLSGLLTGILLMISFTAYAASDIKLIINGQDITTEAQPIIVDGRTLVPARAIAERLGATVAWDAKTNTVIVTSVKAETASPPEQAEQSTRPSIEWLTPEEATEKYSENLSQLNLAIAYSVSNTGVDLKSTSTNKIVAVFGSDIIDGKIKIRSGELEYYLREFKNQ